MLDVRAPMPRYELPDQPAHLAELRGVRAYWTPIIGNIHDHHPRAKARRVQISLKTTLCDVTIVGRNRRMRSKSASSRPAMTPKRERFAPTGLAAYGLDHLRVICS
jgi:hypothetical protein